MLYNLALSYASFILMSYLYILNIKNNKRRNLRSSLFILIIINTGIFITIDILLGVAFKYTDSYMFQRITRCSRWVELIVSFYFLVIYIICSTYKAPIKSLGELFKAKKKLYILTAIITISILIYIIFIPYDGFDIDNPTFTPGTSSLLNAITLVSISLITIHDIIINYKNLTRTEKATYIFLFAELFGILTIQFIVPQTSMSPMGFTIISYYLYCIIENPNITIRIEEEADLDKTDNDFKTKNYLITSIKNKLDLHVSELRLINRKFNKENLTLEEKRKIINECAIPSNEIINLLDTRINISSLIEDETINNEKYRVRTFVDRLVANAEGKLENRDLEFVYEIDPNIPFVLSGDINKISIVLFNLIDNAIYYTKYGKIILNVSYNKKNDKTVELIISITDTGEGINKDRIEEINRSINSITFLKKIIEKLNGSLIYESTIGAGSTFYVKVPQTIEDATPMGGYTKYVDYRRKDIEYTDFSSKRILIVDDNRISVKTLKSYLYRYNINPDWSKSGPECISRVKTGIEYDLIFMDDCMEGTTGKDTLELIQKISKLSGYRLAPVVIFTANAVNGARDMYIKRGFADYLGKPIDSLELDKVLKSQLQK